MLLMSRQQLTIVSRSKIKNNLKRVINHDGAFLFAKNLILGDLIGNEAADLKTQVCDHEI